MKQTIAITIWKERISPLFDASRNVRLLHVEEDQRMHRHEAVLDEDTPVKRAQRLSQWGVDVLICGAISRPFARAIESRGICIIPFIAGPFETIVTSYLEGRLQHANHKMPGCGRQHRKHFRGGAFLDF